MQTILTPDSLKRVINLREFMQEAIDFLDEVPEGKREATWLLEKAIYEYHKQTWDIFIAPALQQETFYDKTTDLIERMHAMLIAGQMANLMTIVSGKQTIVQSFKGQLNTSMIDALASVLIQEGIVTEENLREMANEKENQKSDKINQTVSDLMKGMKF